MNRLVAPLVLGLAACGGGGSDSSGVDPQKQIPALSADERTQLCTWAVDAQGGAGHVSDCGDGFQVTTQTVGECTASFATATCTSTVAEIEACMNAIDGDGCAVLTEALCEPLVACAT